MSTIRNTRQPYTLESDDMPTALPATVVCATLELRAYGHQQIEGLASRIAWAFFRESIDLELYESAHDGRGPELVITTVSVEAPRHV